MARTFTPKVGHLVTYFTSDGRPRPAVVVSTGSTNGGIRLRTISHGGSAAASVNYGSGNYGDGTYDQLVGFYGDNTTGIVRGTVDLNSAQVTNTWRPR